MSAWDSVLDAIGLRGPAPAPLPVAPKFPDVSNDSAGAQGTSATTSDEAALRWKMGSEIFDFEAEYRQGKLAIEIDPPDDGGIREVAGITLKYDPQEEPKLEAMVKAGQFDQTKQEAIRYIIENTDGAMKLCANPAIEANVRDMIFNRGLTGCIKIIQKALGVKVDGQFGPISESTEKAAEAEPAVFLDDLYTARVWYEDNIVGVRANLDAGLMSRFAKARDFAKTFIDTSDVSEV